MPDPLTNCCADGAEDLTEIGIGVAISMYRKTLNGDHGKVRQDQTPATSVE